MGRTWLFRLFGAGRIPAPLREQLEREEIVLLEEGIGGAITYKDFRAPGKAYAWKRHWFSGAVALTQVRFVAFAYSLQVINVPYDDPRLKALHCSIDERGHLVVAFDPAVFHDNWSGKVEVRLSTAYAPQICARLAA